MGYITKQSTQILDFLKLNSDRHLTADDVFYSLRQSGNQIGRTTVYRHLERLYEDGIIKKYTLGDGSSACYQYFGNAKQCHTHYHLKCLKCGILLHTECDFLNELSDHILNQHDFTVDGEKTVLYGLCGECRKKG